LLLKPWKIQKCAVEELTVSHIQTIKIPGYVSVWYLSRIKNGSHAHKTKSWFLVWVSFVISVSIPVIFIWEPPPPLLQLTYEADCTNAFYLMSMAMAVCPFITKSSMVYFIYFKYIVLCTVYIFYIINIQLNETYFCLKYHLLQITTLKTVKYNDTFTISGYVIQTHN